MTTDEERWTQAEEILRDNPGPDARRRMRQRKVLFWSLLGGFLLLGVVVGLVAALLAGPHHVHHTHHPLWQVAAVLTTAVAGTVFAVVALVVLWRSRQLRNPWHSPQSALNRRQRRELSRMVLGKRPVDPARLPLARDLARRLAVTMRAQLLIFLGVLLTYASQLLERPSGWRLWLPLTCIGIWLVLAPLALRNAARMKRFLAEHPASDGDGA